MNVELWDLLPLIARRNRELCFERASLLHSACFARRTRRETFFFSHGSIIALAFRRGTKFSSHSRRRIGTGVDAIRLARLKMKMGKIKRKEDDKYTARTNNVILAG